MRLLMCFQHYILPTGASGTRLHEYSKTLASLGHEVTVICGNHKYSGFNNEVPFKFGRRILRIDGVTIHQYNIHYSNSLSMPSRSLRFVLYFLVASIYCLLAKYEKMVTSTVPPTVTPLCWIVTILRKKPAVLEITDLWPDLPRAMGLIKSPLILKFLTLLEFVGYKYASNVICYAEGVEVTVKNRYPQLTGRIVTIPNGVDLSHFSKEGHTTSLHEYGIADEDFVAIFTGAHGWANGLDYLIDAAIELQRQQEKNVWIVLVGDGFEKKRLMRRASENGLDRLCFMNPVPKNQIAPLLRRANVALQILKDVPEFYYGTSPNKFFEYLGSGLPVIFNYPGWIADLNDIEKFGIQVSSSNASTLSSLLIRLKNDPTKLSILSKNAQRLAEHRYSTKDLGKKWCREVETAKKL